MVTSAASLIHGVVHYYADDYKGCVQLAVSRLSRVRLLYKACEGSHIKCTLSRFLVKTKRCIEVSTIHNPQSRPFKSTFSSDFMTKGTRNY